LKKGGSRSGRGNGDRVLSIAGKSTLLQGKREGGEEGFPLRS